MKARVPWLTAGVGVAVLACGFSPAWSEALQFDRAALERDEIWRLLGASLTHWRPSHLACELAVFLACGWFIERQSRSLFAVSLLGGAIAVTCALFALAPEIETYRGLSGANAALFGAAAVELMRLARAARSRLAAVLSAAGVLVLLGKTIADFIPALTQRSGAEVTTTGAPLGHLAGIVAGLLFALALRTFSQGWSPRRLTAGAAAGDRLV